MKASRAEVLRELGLMPVWRLRRTARDTEATPVERHARIAQLAFDALHYDIASSEACGLCRRPRRTVPGDGTVAA